MLSACAITRSTVEAQAALSSHFVGKSFSVLVAQWGLPGRSASLSNGRQLLEYHFKLKERDDDYAGRRLTNTYRCQAHLVISSKDSIIRSVSLLGDAAACDVMARSGPLGSD